MNQTCQNCGKHFEGISRNYCSWNCAEADGLPKKLVRTMLNDIGHLKKQC